jgi:hypothetical protein
LQLWRGINTNICSLLSDRHDELRAEDLLQQHGSEHDAQERDGSDGAEAEGYGGSDEAR